MDSKKIVIASGKGGVGKTTITANLGRALAEFGKRVALVDVDFGLNNLDVVLGVENQILYDLQDVLDGKCRVKQALVQDKYKKNLFILPSGRVDSITKINGQNLKLIIDSFINVFDYVLIDAPAGIELGFHRAISCADEGLVVATPTITSLRDADKVLSILRSYKMNKVSLIINRARGDLILDNKMMLPSDIKLLLKTDLIGVLPDEDDVFLSAGNKLSKKTDSYKAYKIIAENILKEKNNIFDVTTKYSGFFGSIKRGIKRSLWIKMI